MNAPFPVFTSRTIASDPLANFLLIMLLAIKDFSATVAVTSRSAYSFLSAGARLAVCPAIATPTSDTCFKKAPSDMDVLNPSKHSNLSMVPPV